MLKVALENDIDKYFDAAFSLAEKPQTASFPIYFDGIKTKEDFRRALYNCVSDDRAEVLLFSDEKEVKGIIAYYVIDRSQYLSFDAFLAWKDLPLAINEFVDYAKRKYRGYSVDFGFPKENKKAVFALKNLGFETSEESAVFVGDIGYKTVREDLSIHEITAESFADFKTLHDEKTDTYWTSDRLFDEISKSPDTKWRVYARYAEDRAVAATYCITYGKFAEIFGFDFERNTFDKESFLALFSASKMRMKEDGAEKVLYFSEKEEESELLRKLGMRKICDYVLLSGVL